MATFHVAHMLRTPNSESLEEVFLHSFLHAKFNGIDLESGDVAPPPFQISHESTSDKDLARPTSRDRRARRNNGTLLPWAPRTGRALSQTAPI